MMKMMNPFIGLCYGQICAPKDSTDEEILKFANETSPPGTEAGWGDVIKNGKIEYDKSLWPVQCDIIEENYHYILVC